MRWEVSRRYDLLYSLYVILQQNIVVKSIRYIHIMLTARDCDTGILYSVLSFVCIFIETTHANPPLPGRDTSARITLP